MPYVVGKKPLKYGESILQPGEHIPGAEDWLRVDSWERSGLVRYVNDIPRVEEAREEIPAKVVKRVQSKE